MRPFPLLVTGAVLAAAPAAQPVVVPSKATLTAPTVFDDGRDPYLLWGGSGAPPAARVQYLYDTSDIGVATATFGRLQFRAAHDGGALALTVDLDLTLAMSGRTSQSSSVTFASNVGSGATRVFTGTLSLPAFTPGTWPAPWQAPVVFSQPFPYDASTGSALLVDATATANSAGQPWIVEGYSLEHGMAFSELSQQTCISSIGRPTTGRSFNAGGLIPGGQFWVRLTPYPTNTPSLALNFLAIGTGGVGTTWAGITLPVGLQGLGLPSPPNCQWAISVAMTLPMIYDSTAGALSLPPLPLPNTPSLAGLTFYSQAAAVDTNATTGAAEIFPGIALRWVIGTGALLPATRIHAVFDPAAGPPAAGQRTKSQAATLRLDV